MASKLIKFKDQKIVNLQNVSSIAVLPEKNRIVFNMNYSISLPNSDKLISDYVYWEAQNSSELNIMERVFHSEVCKWFQSPKNEVKRFINPEHISSIVFDTTSQHNQFKVIFNLSNTVSMKGNSGFTSDFVYFKFTNISDFSKYTSNILTCV